jgi:hypothetical protein
MSKFVEKEVVWAPIGSLFIPPGAQRDYKPRWAAELAERFDPEMMDPLSVSKRTNGDSVTWWVNDGQHRRDAALKWGLTVEDCLPCWPSASKLSTEQMAEKFLQGQERKAVGPFERYTMGVTAGRPAECDVQGVIDRAGLKVSRQHDPGCISAVSALMSTYHGPGRAALYKALCVWRDAFLAEPDTNTATLLRGLGLLFGRYHEVDPETVVGALVDVPTGVLMEHARRNRARYGRQIPDCMAVALVDRLNRKLSRGEKLAPWWREIEAA